MDVEINPKNLANRIREAIKSRGWTQAELARRSGLTTAHLSDILQHTNKGQVSYRTVYSIARALGMSTEELLGLPSLVSLSSAKLDPNPNLLDPESLANLLRPLGFSEPQIHLVWFLVSGRLETQAAGVIGQLLILKGGKS